MPSRTPYETWVQAQERKQRRDRECVSSAILLAILLFWSAVIYGLTVVF